MIIGHAPAGYITGVLLSKRICALGPARIAFLIAAVSGAIAPDVDMLYFHLLDHRQHHHHTYFTHWPVVWLACTAVALAWMHKRGNSRRAPLAFVFCLGGLIHMLLDSVVGHIWWLAPLVDRPFALWTVPAVYTPWWLNFLLHWSFALELALCASAWMLYRSRVRAERSAGAGTSKSPRGNWPA
jgi:hypothetical protein